MRPLLAVLSPASIAVGELCAFLAAVANAADLFVLRCEGLSVREVTALARSGAGLVSRPAIYVSDRPDVALAAGCEGVQLKERSLSVASTRRAFTELRVGASRHDPAGLAAAHGAHHVFLSPFAPTASKPGVPALGPEGFAACVRGLSTPVVALGGIDPRNAAQALAAGAAGVAVRSAVWADADPVDAVWKLRRSLDSA